MTGEKRLTAADQKINLWCKLFSLKENLYQFLLPQSVQKTNILSSLEYAVPLVFLSFFWLSFWLWMVMKWWSQSVNIVRLLTLGGAHFSWCSCYPILGAALELFFFRWIMWSHLSNRTHHFQTDQFLLEALPHAVPVPDQAPAVKGLLSLAGSPCNQTMPQTAPW